MRTDCCGVFPHRPGCPWAPDNTVCVCAKCGDDIYEDDIEIGWSDGHFCGDCLEDMEEAV